MIQNLHYYILTTYFEERSDKMLGKNVTYKIDQDKVKECINQKCKQDAIIEKFYDEILTKM